MLLSDFLEETRWMSEEDYHDFIEFESKIREKRVKKMWESPIDVIYSQMQTKYEGEVLKAVQSVGINVNKEELIKALDYDREQYRKGYQDALPKWIPCSERLPEENKEYFITWKTSISKTNYISIADFDYGKWVLDEYIYHYPNVEVIAWMPLIEPYESEVE